jgi:hypothetical protein
LTLFEIASDIGKLVEEKNKAYGSSFSKSGEILKILYPEGVRPDQYTDMLLIVRCLDKFFRISAEKYAFGENPWRDIAGYGICGTSVGPEKTEETSKPAEPTDDPRRTASPRLPYKS